MTVFDLRNNQSRDRWTPNDLKVLALRFEGVFIPSLPYGLIEVPGHKTAAFMEYMRHIGVTPAETTLKKVPPHDRPR